MKTIFELPQKPSSPLIISGIHGSFDAYLIAQLAEKHPEKKFVYITPESKEALKLVQNIRFFLKPEKAAHVCFFSAYDVLPLTHLSPHTDIVCDRLKTLFSLQSEQANIVVVPFTAILTYLPPTDFLKSISIQVQQTESRDHLIHTLSEWGYQQVPVVSDRGTFAVRGSLIDCYSAQETHPHRIEFFDDEIVSIRTFETKTQKKISDHDSFTLIPTQEVILTNETLSQFLSSVKKLADTRDLPKASWAEFAEKVKNKISFAGIQSYLSLFYKDPSTFLDWLPENSILTFQDWISFERVHEEHRLEIKNLIQEKYPLFTEDDVLIPVEKIKNSFADFPQMIVSPFRTPFDKEDSIFFDIETHESLRGEIEKHQKSISPLLPLLQKINRARETDRVVLIASSHAQCERLQDLLNPHLETPVQKLDHYRDDLQPGTVAVIEGQLSQGFCSREHSLTLITDEEIFGKKIKRRSLPESAFASFSDLKPGQAIVHRDHGIGLYQGLLHMTIEGVTQDFMIIEYRSGDKLYLPVYRMNLIQLYKGVEGVQPTLDKMGGSTWVKIKGKAEKFIRELAGELLNLYALRQSSEGFAFSPPNELFESFEASFPYEETPDQERAIRDVLQDMEKSKPMDRLVLGDVGYGKTEVALRAAFKAVLDDKQVCFLVPTTLLAFQHFERFKERFKDTAVRVEMLSRFRTVAEQKKILEETRQGKVDILIGTHRLLQPDISFKNLGLLTIDEEHRFGVSHKEKIKRLRKNVDVLALSATPIPRTLYMSLVGLRGISVIETPPQDRLAIRTFVMPFEEAVIRDSILREIKRGGQVFFVHNEVHSMPAMKDFLQQLVPEAKIEMGHGQMDESTLEDLMIRFFHQDFQLLLCTTIIESGIDVPNANTILINKADHFGLAQIYQLRGRVGRGNHRAYAYLLVEPQKKLTAEAEQRLGVLQRFSDLGSGYQIATYDLEIRGAGNLLGEEQSGQMTAIGYELYTELLEKAIRELKGEHLIHEIDPELHFKVSSYIPDDYIPDPPIRLEIYRRLSALPEEDNAYTIEDELRDRFGPLPFEVENLLELSIIKCLAKKLRLKQIRFDGRNLVLAFDPSSSLSPEFLTRLVKDHPKTHRLTPDFRLMIQKSFEKESLGMAYTKKILRELLLHV